MLVTMPSPTRAMIVSSVAPPTKRSRFVRTVTRAFTFTPMPSFATPSMVVRPLAAFGQSITFGLMLVLTASSTVFVVPFVARSMAQVRFQSSVMARLVRRDEGEDAVVKVATGEVVGFDRSVSRSSPALIAVMRASTTCETGTPRRRIAIIVIMATGALATRARIQIPRKLNRTSATPRTTTTMMPIVIGLVRRLPAATSGMSGMFIKRRDHYAMTRANGSRIAI